MKNKSLAQTLARYTCFVLFVFTAQTLGAFNFTQEMRKIQKITNTFELIASYQKMAKQVQKDDSIRLSKKLIRMITNLHPLVDDHEDATVKLAFKNLLETAIANKKLQSVDYTNELSALFTHYSPQAHLAQAHPAQAHLAQAHLAQAHLAQAHLAKELITKNKTSTEEIVEKIIEDVTKQAPEEQAIEEIVEQIVEEILEQEIIVQDTQAPSVLKEKIDVYLKNNPSARKDVIYLLSFKKLTRKVDQLSQELSHTNPELKHIYRKLDAIEQMLKENLLGEYPLKSLAALLDSDERAE